MKLVAEEASMKDLKGLHDQSITAAMAARKAVETNALNLQKQLAERSKLLSQLDNAKMQERMNAALKQMNELQPKGDVPTLAEVRDKIETRYAKALGESEIRTDSVGSKMMEVEKAQLDAEAASRLDALRVGLGLAPASVEPQATSTVETGEAATVSGGGAAGAGEGGRRRLGIPRRTFAALALAAQVLSLLAATPARAGALQVVNVSARPGNQSEAAIAVDPNDPANVVVVSNTTIEALFVGVSHDGGASWARRLIATGHALGRACCDPSMSWDEQGNLFLSWLDDQRFDVIPVAISTDAGDSWELLTVLHAPEPQRAARVSASRTTRQGRSQASFGRRRCA